MSLELPRIPGYDREAARAAEVHQASLTKPQGSLGRLEFLAAWYAGVRGRFPIPVPARAELMIFAADHGVAVEGVSAFPSAVTAAMVANFRSGGAAVNVLARQCGLEVTVIDVGVDGPEEGSDEAANEAANVGVSFVNARVRRGTRNLRREPALSTAEVAAAVGVGLRMARDAAARGADILVGGDMGIGNTTAAAALVCAFGGDDPGDIVGRGTGIDDGALVRKAAVIRDAMRLHDLSSAEPLVVLGAVGGLEIAALTGLMLAGAAARLPVVVDGFIAGAAALVATRLCPEVRSYLLLSHLSAERGARRLCALLGDPPPLLDLGLRLGEGTGAALVVPLLRAAVAAQVEMATFSSAGVPDRA